MFKTNRLLKPIRTDQDLCYDQTGAEIPCPGTGQDGELKKGRPWPGPRFEVRGDQVVDRLTGRIWTKSANLPGFPLTWEEGQVYVEDMNKVGALGRSDWKLPSRKALFSLLSHVHTHPALPEGHPFVDVFSGYYWTCITVDRFRSQAWYVHLGGGRVFKGMKHGSYMIWPVVKNGQDEISAVESESASDQLKPRFIDRGPTILDPFTGLEWTRQATVNGGTLDWDSALEAVRSLNARKAYGFSDWRLPNVRELESLVCLEAHMPALSPGHPFSQVQGSYWSATTSTYEPSYAWVLHMDDGAVGVGFKKSREFSAWPVRDG